MAKHRVTLLMAVTAVIVAAGHTSAQLLVPLGALPKLAADWEVSADDQQPDPDAANEFRWIVFRNKRTGDLLSLATHPELGKNRTERDVDRRKGSHFGTRCAKRRTSFI